jgi:hypothetical protein
MILSAAATAVIIDRIAVVVGDAVIKDSDINRDVRLVSFLNREKLSFDLTARKAAANRLIDQSLIQREIDLGDYQVPAQSDADKLFLDTQRERAPSPAAFARMLEHYGLSTAQMKSYLYWQLTVLRFIDQRFRPSVLVTDEDAQAYYQQHSGDFKTKNGEQKTLDEASAEIREILTNQQINKQFDSWLRARRRSAGVEYHEADLK